MLGWTNSNVVWMEFTYSLNVSSSHYYPPKKTNKQTHTKTPQKLPKKNKPKNNQNSYYAKYFYNNKHIWVKSIFFSSKDLHTVAQKPDTIKHITSKEELLLSIVVAMATYVMTWLMTMGSGGINKPWSFPGISANFILLHSKIWNSIIRPWIIKEGENSQYHY